MSERIHMEGHLYEARRKAKTLEISIKNLRDTIRGKLYPFDTIDAIDTEAVQAAAFELSARMIDYKELTAKIAALKKALGI